MKIADALLLQKDLTEEAARLRQLANSEGWEYRTISPGSKWSPTFDIEENHRRVRELSKLHRKLSRSVSRANNSTDLDLDDTPYKEWL